MFICVKYLWLNTSNILHLMTYYLNLWIYGKDSLIRCKIWQWCTKSILFNSHMAMVNRMECAANSGVLHISILNLYVKQVIMWTIVHPHSHVFFLSVSDIFQSVTKYHQVGTAWVYWPTLTNYCRFNFLCWYIDAGFFFWSGSP